MGSQYSHIKYHVPTISLRPILKGHFSFVYGDLRQLHKTTRHSAKMTQTSHRVSFYCKKVIQLLLLLLVLTYYSLTRKKSLFVSFQKSSDEKSRWASELKKILQHTYEEHMRNLIMMEYALFFQHRLYALVFGAFCLLSCLTCSLGYNRQCSKILN